MQRLQTCTVCEYKTIHTSQKIDDAIGKIVHNNDLDTLKSSKVLFLFILTLVSTRFKHTTFMCNKACLKEKYAIISILGGKLSQGEGYQSPCSKQL